MIKKLPLRRRKATLNFPFPLIPRLKQNSNSTQIDRGERRKLKRMASLFFILLVFLCLSTLIGVIGYFIYNNISFSFAIPIESKQIVKPVVTSATIKDFETLLKKSLISYTSLSYSRDGNYITLILSEGTEVIFTPLTDPIYQVSSLQSLLKRLTIDNVSKGSDKRFINKPKKIDFRYNKPIVVF